MYQPDSFVRIKDCIVLENCANGKCLIAAFFQGENPKMRAGDIDIAIAEAIDLMVKWLDATDMVRLVVMALTSLS